MHPRFVLLQAKDQVSLLEGASANSLAVVATEALLIDGCARAR